MNRRLGILTAACAYALAFAFALPSLAGDEKQLQNVKGSVSYQAPNKTPVIRDTSKANASTGNDGLALMGRFLAPAKTRARIALHPV